MSSNRSRVFGKIIRKIINKSIRRNEKTATF